MGKLDPNLLIMVLAAAAGGYWFFKMGGKQMLEGMTAPPAAAAVDPEADVDPAPEAAKEDTEPEPTSPDVEEEWSDSGGTNIYIIKVDGWMWVNNRRMYPPDHEMWHRYYQMRKYRWRHRGCLGKYRNSRWCKDKHRFCTGAWRNTPWCRGFKRGWPKPRPQPQPYPKPPRGGGGGPPRPPHNDTNNCRPFISKHGRTYRFTRDPMPDVMPAIFPPPYIKEGNCVYKLDNNQGSGDNGRGGWDGDRGGSSGGNWWDKIGDAISGKTSFYTYNRIGNV